MEEAKAAAELNCFAHTSRVSPLCGVPQPMVYFRSSIFKGANLFHLTERASAGATVTGNIFALFGALGSNKNVEVVVGTLFTTLNMCFVTSLLYAFNKDVRKVRDKIMPSDSGDGADILHRASTNNRT